MLLSSVRASDIDASDFDSIGIELSDFLERASAARPMSLSAALRRAIDAKPPARFHTMRMVRVSGLIEDEIARVDLRRESGSGQEGATYLCGASPEDMVIDWHSAGCMPDEHPGCFEVNVLVR